MGAHSPAAAVPLPPAGVVSRKGRWSSSATPFGVKVARAVLILGLIPASAYVAPRVINLVVTPDRLDQTIVHADKYNPRLHQIVEREQGTLASLDALERVKTSLAEVRVTVASVHGELLVLIDQITGDVQNILNLSNAEVTNLQGKLSTLESRLRGLNGPIGGAADAVAKNRAVLSQIIREGRATGGDVHDARRSADNSADNVDGGR